VPTHVELPASLLAELEVRVVQTGRARPCGQRGEELLGEKVLMDVDALYLRIMRARSLRSESATLKVVIAYPDMVLPLWR
jgi:hypothetical protein